jgi:hypothetical protein
MATRDVNRECYQHSTLSLALTEEKAVRLNEAVKKFCEAQTTQGGIRSSASPVFSKNTHIHRI